ncbi:chemotaxis protein CheX [Microvirga pudoricolor]|uniref:chemotaxis protein CheX n=1 Tax=Microvirga pudoricolor TaxID=2778729 RepID=UPI0019500CA4|nr:chemotaxis protein CheX [Microvirga pudoricolor]MBM6595238.1 chemotaxis protein CheX [Microvirga pudoricolor]
MSYDIDLSDLERDALTELVNIGVSRSAASLRKMVGEQVLLSVPSVEVMSRKAAATLVGEREADQLVAVQQTFEGVFAGRALLIFPEASSLELVRAVAGDELSGEDLIDIENEALAETGNVVLNGCLATMANMLQRSLTMSLPQVLRGDGALLFAAREESDREGLVLFLYINFSIRHRDIRGYIAMLMDVPSLAALKQLIRSFIERVTAESEAGTSSAASG